MCNSVKLSPQIDRRLYNYVKRLQEDELNYVTPAVAGESREVCQYIEQRTNDVLKMIELKVKSLLPGANLTVEHNMADNSDYLMVYSDKTKPQIPASKRLSWLHNTLCAWKLNNLGQGQRMSLGLNGSTYQDPLEILERRVEDIDVVGTNKKLMTVSDKPNSSIQLTA